MDEFYQDARQREHDRAELASGLAATKAGVGKEAEVRTRNETDPRTGRKSSGRSSKGANSPTKAAARSPTQASARSPTKATSPRSPIKKTARKSPTRPRRSSADALWDKKFHASSSRGATLRKLEMKAYAAHKEGKVFRGVSPSVTEADAARAMKQGVERARAEQALRALGEGKEQRVREGYEGRVVELDGDEEDDDDDDEMANGKGRKGSRAQRRPSSATRGKSSAASQPPAPPSSRRTSAASPTGTRPPHRNLSDPSRGPVHSITNPANIHGTDKPNPFFESMPGPEVWHRNLPAYFMGGETPFMAAEVSREISADLARGE